MMVLDMDRVVGMDYEQEKCAKRKKSESESEDDEKKRKSGPLSTVRVVEIDRSVVQVWVKSCDGIEKMEDGRFRMYEEEKEYLFGVYGCEKTLLGEVRVITGSGKWYVFVAEGLKESEIADELYGLFMAEICVVCERKG